ncbi:unnamed protein product [Phaedon cochleariae]|uniref:SIAH-type domain-containing protein n=1 Tax=Phaedon cochleariae TaxID=80249 RepID=A0A9P0DPX3_PHACE|nr:unnamed protein product [Phaedon cochleariae]
MVVYLCPADRKYTCSWEGQAEDILHHFELEHDDLLHFSDTFTILPSVPSENRLLLIDEEIYLAQVKCQQKSLDIRLRYLGPTRLAKKISYNLLLRVDNELVPVGAISVQDGSYIVNLDKIQEACIRCTLNVTRAQTTSEDEADSICIKMSLEETASEADKPEVELRQKPSEISLSRSRTINWLDTKRKLVSRCKSTLSLGAISETVQNCSNCGIHLVPPIYFCPCGQSFCDRCRTSTCQSCRSRVTEDRNYGLETKLSRSPLSPCKYQKFGCPLKLFTSDLRDHETHCVFCEYKCPIGECSFEGQFRNMVKHLKVIHGSTKLLECFFVSFQTHPEAFLAIEEKGIFYCRMVFRNATFLFEAIFCGPPERKFFCELRFKEGKMKQPMMLHRTENVYRVEISQMELKKMKLKAKHALLTITA